VTADTCIDVLVIRGALLMQRFLQGEVTDSIAWLEQNQKQLVRSKNSLLRRAIIPFVVGGLIFFNPHSLLSPLVRLFESIGLHKHILTTVIPFSEANKFFGQSTVGYVVSTLFASLVQSLKSANLLF
jgi:hypothetical protein